MIFFCTFTRNTADTFCAFECGIAHTIQNFHYNVGPPPLPAYLQHIQALDRRMHSEQQFMKKNVLSGLVSLSFENIAKNT